MKYAWLNGRLAPCNDAIIKSLKENYNTCGTYEYIPFYNQKLFKCEEYINRLFASARILALNMLFCFNDIKQAAEKLIALNNFKNGFIKAIIYLNNRQVVIDIFCLQEKIKNPKNKLNLKISSYTQKRVDYSHFNHIKASYFFHGNYIAQKRALSKRFDDAIILDSQGNVTQATFANLFIIKDRILYTAPTEICFNGITRKLVIQVAQKNNLPVIEQKFNLSDLFSADEAFLTDSLNKIGNIASIDNHQYKNTSITNMLNAKFQELIR